MAFVCLHFYPNIRLSVPLLHKKKSQIYIIYDEYDLIEKQVNILIERPDSWDDYCVSNALTLFRGTKI